MKTFISNKDRKKLMQFLLDTPEKEIGVRSIAKACSVSPGFVSKFISSLEKDNFVKKGMVNLTNPELRALKILFNIERIKIAFDFLKKEFNILAMGVYGSWAHGTNTSGSDIDLWILLKRDPKPIESTDIRNAIRAKIGKVELNLVFLTKEKLELLKKKDPVFFYTLYHSFHIGGEKIV
jgi:predicted nucleotidyltransferase